MAASDKDTIYIDIDDEITGIIDKLNASEGKVVALVLPKRASVFQSIVNMKLLKRAADSSKKHLVLITSEAGLLPLAGVAGVHVAKTLTSKPEIPSAPQLDEGEETVAEDTGEPVESEVDPSQPVGQLVGTKPSSDGVETLVLDDEDLPPEADDKSAGAKTFEPPTKGKGKGKKDKKLSVPNFDRFRLLLIGGGLLLILLIGGIIFAAVAMPKATIKIKADTTNVDLSLGLNLSTAAKELNPANGTIPAKLVQQQKTATQQVPTTGQRNNGNKASGNVTVTNCSKNDSEHAIPAGTGFSSNGNTYISQQAVTVPPSDFSGGGSCKNNGKASVSVLAQSGGASYNLPGGSSFSIAGNPGYLSAQGGGMTGGTDSIVQSVNQNDITNAKNKMVAATEAEMKRILNDQLKKERYYPIEATYSAGAPTVTTSANVGEVATTVTVTQTITYTMFGVPESDLRKLVEAEIKTHIDPDKQSILDNGISKATYNVGSLSATAAQLTMSSVAVAGPDLDVETIKQLAAGKKPGPIKDELKNNPDVSDVTIELSPFWVSSIPKKIDKIKVEIAKPDTKAPANNSNDSDR